LNAASEASGAIHATLPAHEIHFWKLIGLAIKGSLWIQSLQNALIHRVIRLPGVLLRANWRDNFCRTMAHYLLAPRARQLSLRLLDPHLHWLGPDTRFSLDYWLCRFRRTDASQRWLASLTDVGIDIPAVLFRSSERDVTEAPDLGWRRYLPVLDIVTVPGDHASMLSRQHRLNLANQFLKQMDVEALL
jgi:hypothetical protein